MFLLETNDDKYFHKILPVCVRCDLGGCPLDFAEFSSKSGDNFNHKIEWEKRFSKAFGKSYNFFPRGRVEIKNGVIKVFANPIILEDEEAKELIIQTFEIEVVKERIKWIADNSKHYSYIDNKIFDGVKSIGKNKMKEGRKWKLDTQGK